MKKGLNAIAAILVLATVFGCKNNPPKTAEATRPAAQAPPARQTGTVIEFINASNYTYVHVDTGKDKIWAAAPAFEVKSGDKVVIPAGMAMRNYRSESLGRTFDLVYFVANITKEGSAGESSRLPEGHPKIGTRGAGTPAARIDFSGITKPKGGKTVAEIYKEKKSLSGRQVTVRAKVVKYNPGIMGKNWLHLRDGTGREETNDLTVTTNARTKVGDTVLVKGLVTTDKDYGFGYKYAVIIEDAEITVE